ncbi:MAG: hypothetical protein JNM43_18155 [Planctomycetaceae bacterium]|nr:hypothetical protein [Planctomycetaceae bacterium]
MQHLSFIKPHTGHLIVRRGVDAACCCIGILLALVPYSALHSQEPSGFRLPDDRKPLTKADFEAMGLHVVESAHLRLVTDLPVETVKDLPPLADKLYAALSKELGPLKPAADRADFQATGYLMEARERFESNGLLPDGDFVIRHGRHLGYQFWLNNQTSSYYRRHLLLHEYIHCYLMCEYGMQNIPPLWYTEGIAEYFATHDAASGTFGILPSKAEGFEGWGRISELQLRRKDPETQSESTLPSILQPTDTSFTSELKYAQGWAMVWMIRNHPELKSHFESFAAIRTRDDYKTAKQSIDKKVWDRLPIVWLLTLDSLTEGFQTEHSFAEVQPTFKVRRSKDAPLTIDIKADRDWQSSGLSFDEPTKIAITAEGRYAVNDQPKPWISEPQGVTIRYWQGRPLGEVTAIFVSRDGSSVPVRLPIGRGATLDAPADSELWLQINDSAASRADNSGTVKVTIR